MSNQSPYPGIVLYFEKLIPFLEKMEDRQAGEFLRAVISYARTGELPTLKSRIADLAFAVMRPSVDADREKYLSKVRRREAHARYMWDYRRRQAGEQPLPEEDYRQREEETDCDDPEPPVNDHTAHVKETDAVNINKNEIPNQNKTVNKNIKQNKNVIQEQNPTIKTNKKEEPVPPAGLRPLSPGKDDGASEGSGLFSRPVYTPPTADEFETLRREAIRKLTGAAAGR